MSSGLPPDRHFAGLGPRLRGTPAVTAIAERLRDLFITEPVGRDIWISLAWRAASPSPSPCGPTRASRDRATAPTARMPRLPSIAGAPELRALGSVDLEAQLSHPAWRFNHLVELWRQLPPDEAPQRATTPPRTKQRAEDRIGAQGVAQLVADYRAGRSTKWLQRTYGLSQGAVLRLLDVNGVSRRTRGLTEEQVREAIRLYGRGWSLTRIGDHFGKDHTVVKNALTRAGIVLRPPSRS